MKKPNKETQEAMLEARGLRNWDDLVAESGISPAEHTQLKLEAAHMRIAELEAQFEATDKALRLAEDKLEMIESECLQTEHPAEAILAIIRDTP